MAQAIVAYLHYLSIFLLFALLVLQHRLLRLPLDLERARSLAAIDRGYGLCALAVLASGLARVLWYGKGVDYYLHNGLFHAKVGLFVLAALVSLLPTVTFLGWYGKGVDYYLHNGLFHAKVGLFVLAALVSLLPT
ncbi:DUF2214 family protein, partial [Pseudomonas aeruginosa]